MIAEIRELLARRPFIPFHVLTSVGNRYRIATSDHADVSPRGTQVMIWFDDDGGVTLAGLHIIGVEKEPGHAAQMA